MARFVTFLFGLYAALVFLASLVVHVLSLIPGEVVSLERVVWLHLAAMAAFFALVVHAALTHNREAGRGYCDDFHAELLSRVPCAVGAIGVALLAYAILNFVHFAATVEGSAEVRDGAYVLMKKAVVVREITEAEYHEHRRLDVQGLSGHWLVFSWAAVSYFFFFAPRVREEFGT